MFDETPPFSTASLDRASEGREMQSGSFVTDALERLQSGADRRWQQTSPRSSAYWRNHCWDREVAMRDPRLGAEYRHETDELTRLIRDSGSSGHAIDVGCGSGLLTHVILDCVDARTVTALDISRAALERTSQRCATRKLALVQADVCEWTPSDPSKFDLVVCVDALHHIDFVERVLPRLSGLVSQSGILIGNVWTRDNYVEFLSARYGQLQAGFRIAAYAAASITDCSRRVFSALHRSALIPASIVRSLLERNFATICELHHGRYFSRFACRGPRHA